MTESFTRHRKWLSFAVALLLVSGASGGTIWDGGGGTGNTSIDTPSNWDSDSPPAFDGSAYVTFGSGGATATVNIPASFLGIGFNREGGFTLANGSGALTLGAGGLTAVLPSTNACTYTIAEDLTITSDQAWGITNNTGVTTVTVSGRISDGTSSYGITRSGSGTLVLSGDNSYDGPTVVKSNGIIQVSHDNALGSASSPTTIENGARLDLSGGVSVAEPIFLSGQGPNNGGVLINSGVNTLNGLITLVAGSIRINSTGSSSVFTISGGITSSVNPFTVLNAGGGTIRISGKPVNIGAGTLWSDQSGTLVLGASSNTWGNSTVARVTVRTDAASAFPTNTLLDMSNAGRIDLNGFSQVAGNLQSTDGKGSEITSASTATLTLNQTGNRVFDGRLAGSLALTLNGSGGLTLSNALSSTSGDITLNSGTLTVTSGSFLGRSTNIVVNGGTLVLQTGRGIRNTAALRIADGGGAKVNIAAGLTEQIERLYFGSVLQSDGTWGASGSGATHTNDMHFGGTGCILVTNAAATATRDFYVAPGGNATNSGTILSPFATLEQARDAVRIAQMENEPPLGGITVWLRGGTYYRTNTFDLVSADSGTISSPVFYSGYPGETARVSGATQLLPEWFSTVSAASPVWARLNTAARGNVMQVDLAAHGITDFGTLRRRGFGSSSTIAAAELVFDNLPQQLARWPDVGETSPGASNGFAYTVGPTTTTNFNYTGSRPEVWTQAEELWFHGFFMHHWADDHIKSAAVDTNLHTVTLSAAPGYGITNNMPYYAENLLEEITQPGEWYLNRSTGILYFWPPAGPAGHEIHLSMIEVPLMRLTAAQYVTMRDIVFETTRGDLVAITGGNNNTLLHCLLRNAGNYAAKITGVSNGVSSCEISDPGDGGIMLTGGDRPTLTRAWNYVRNCTIHGFSRWSWMYAPAVSVGSGSVGHIVSHNVLYDSPHTAIGLGGGNYHLVEFNEVRDVCKWSSDAGAIYTGRDFGAYGTVFRYNFVHDIAGQFGAGYGTQGIYLDDCIAGIEVFGNICYRISGMGIQHGGGRDIKMYNNVLVKCGKGMNSDARGITWDMSNTWANLQALPYRGPVWSNAFPTLYPMPTNWTVVTNTGYLAPYKSVFSRNVGYGNTIWVNGSSTSYYQEVSNNLTNCVPLFVNETSTNLALASNSPAFSIPGFFDIPFNQIGLESNKTITVQVVGGGTASVFPVQSNYYPMQLPWFSAMPSNLWYFDSWSGAATSTSSGWGAWITNDMALTAVFKPFTAANATPLWWLASHNLPTNDSGALADSDTDGLFNWQEYITGTDPTNDRSTFEIRSVAGSELSFLAAANRSYDVEYRSTLTDTNGWQFLTNRIASSDTIIDIIDPTQGQQRYYRIKARFP